MNTIFVAIPSYRDRETQHTIWDLFEKANEPNRVFVGVCWQADMYNVDNDCFNKTHKLSSTNVRLKIFPYQESDGVCWARHEVHSLYRNETFVMNIDSHSRFTKGWDTLLIQELLECETICKKPFISSPPASYVLPNVLEVNPTPTILRATPFTATGDIRTQGCCLERFPEKSLNGAFIAAGFTFSRALVLKEVPYDPYLYFEQEEIVYSARLFTHGWDIFSSRRVIVFHLYTTSNILLPVPPTTEKPAHKKPLHWNDNSKWISMQARGLARFNHITQHKLSADENVLCDLHLYGLGTNRSLSLYEIYSGIDFKHKTVNQKALSGGFIHNLSLYLQSVFNSSSLSLRHD